MYYSSNSQSDGAFFTCTAKDRWVWTNCLAATEPTFWLDEVLMQSVGCSPRLEPSLGSLTTSSGLEWLNCCSIPLQPPTQYLAFCHILSPTFLLHLPAISSTNKCCYRVSEYLMNYSTFMLSILWQIILPVIYHKKSSWFIRNLTYE